MLDMSVSCFALVLGVQSLFWNKCLRDLDGLVSCIVLMESGASCNPGLEIPTRPIVRDK